MNTSATSLAPSISLATSACSVSARRSYVSVIVFDVYFPFVKLFHMPLRMPSLPGFCSAQLALRAAPSASWELRLYLFRPAYLPPISDDCGDGDVLADWIAWEGNEHMGIEARAAGSRPLSGLLGLGRRSKRKLWSYPSSASKAFARSCHRRADGLGFGWCVISSSCVVCSLDAALRGLRARARFVIVLFQEHFGGLGI